MRIKKNLLKIIKRKICGKQNIQYYISKSKVYVTSQVEVIENKIKQGTMKIQKKQIESQKGGTKKTLHYSYNIVKENPLLKLEYRKDKDVTCLRIYFNKVPRRSNRSMYQRSVKLSKHGKYHILTVASKVSSRQIFFRKIVYM